MTKRQQWGLVWATWAASFLVAESMALRTDLPEAPLSNHLRWVLGIPKKSKHTVAGKVLYIGGAAWLWRHLYKSEVSGVRLT